MFLDMEGFISFHIARTKAKNLVETFEIMLW